MVWFSVLGGDERSAIRTDLLIDERGTHYWDDGGEISAFLNARASELGLPASGQLWDVYLLFPPGARWDDGPSPLAAWGAPVVNERQELQAEVASVVGDGST